MPSHRQIDNCRCCGSSELWTYINLGHQPLANSYHKGESLEKFPLRVSLCNRCFHSQLTVAVDPGVMFRNYLYVSGTTDTFRKHCEALAEDAVKLHPLPARVLDIACNDGTLLEAFMKLGCDVVGVDPAENLREITKEKRIRVEVDYWSDAVASRIGKVDIVTATNVIAHVDDAVGFLSACRGALNPGGIVIIEVPYATNLISKCEFDTIYHEHLSYFLVNSFVQLANRSGLFISNITRTPIHGGSIRFVLSTESKQHCATVDEMVNDESLRGLHNWESYVSFSNQVEDNKTSLLDIARKTSNEGSKLIGYGASAKGNTMLNHFGLKLDYIVDDNPMKWGFQTPGMNIPIRNPIDMADDPEPLSIVILSWNFAREICKKIAKIRPGNRGDKCILYVPDVKVIDLPLENTNALSEISA